MSALLEAKTAAHRILVVEDDPHMVGLLAAGLRRAGFTIDTMTDGADVVYQVSRQEYSAIVLDVLLPGPTGLDICAALRQRGRWVPVLMLTALGATADRVRGLRVGADDYLTKPFEFPELVARIQALIRLRDASEAQSLRWGRLRLEVSAQRCFVGEAQVHLTPREIALLRILLRRPGIVLTRRTLLNQAWERNTPTSPNAVDQAIANLRRKIGQDFLETVHGVGYRMVDPPPGA